MTFSVHAEPDFERTYDEDEVIPVRKGDLRAVLDIATMSMDFGSGFLDNEQVEALRKLAEIIGLDPILATPSNFVCVDRGVHTWIFAAADGLSKYGSIGARDHWYCALCRHTVYEDPNCDTPLS